MLAKIGIKVNLVAQSQGPHFTLIQKNPPETEFYLLGWGVPTYDCALHLLVPLPHARRQATAAGTRRAIPIPSIDKKIESLTSEIDIGQAQCHDRRASGRRCSDETIYIAAASPDAGLRHEERSRHSGVAGQRGVHEVRRGEVIGGPDEPSPSSPSATSRSPSRRGAARSPPSTASPSTSRAGEVLGVVGESGAGKSLTGAAVIGLLEPPGRIIGGEVRLERPAHRQPAAEEMRKVRGPAHRHGVPGPADQPQPALPHRRPDRRDHPHARARLARREARERAIALLQEAGIQGAQGAHRQLSARVLGRHAPARGAGAGAVRGARPADRRRADHGARRVDPGADHRAAQAAVPRAGHGRDADHPRHGRDRRDRRPRGRHVCRPHRRDRPGARRGAAARTTPTPRA